MGIQSIDLESCDGCGICCGACPEDVIRLSEHKASIVYPEDCIACFMCEVLCPAQAVKVNPDRARVLPMPY